MNEEKEVLGRQYGVGKSGDLVFRMTVFTKFEVRC